MTYANGVVLILCAAVCLVLLIIGFVAPRFSKRLESGLDSEADRSDQKALDAPGPFVKPLEKTAHLSQTAADKSSEAGRAAREKLGG